MAIGPVISALSGVPAGPYGRPSWRARHGRLGWPLRRLSDCPVLASGAVWHSRLYRRHNGHDPGLPGCFRQPTILSSWRISSPTSEASYQACSACRATWLMSVHASWVRLSSATTESPRHRPKPLRQACGSPSAVAALLALVALAIAAGSRSADTTFAQGRRAMIRALQCRHEKAGQARPSRTCRRCLFGQHLPSFRAPASVAWVRAKEITAQMAIPTTIGSGVPSKNTPATMANAPMANCSVPMQGRSAIDPCSSIARTEVLGMTRPTKP